MTARRRATSVNFLERSLSSDLSFSDATWPFGMYLTLGYRCLSLHTRRRN